MMKPMPMPLPRRPQLATPENFLQGGVSQVRVTLVDAAGSDVNVEKSVSRSAIDVRTSLPSVRQRKRGWSFFTESDDASSTPGRTATSSDDSSVASFDLFTSSPPKDERPTKSPRRRATEDYLQDSVLTFSSEVTPDDTSCLHAQENPVPTGDSVDNTAGSNILHITCLYFPHDPQAIETALRACHPQAPQVSLKLPQSDYSFPLHIALSKCAASQGTAASLRDQANQQAAVKLLARAAPSILHTLDGPPGEEVTPLALALSLRLDSQICRFLLQAHLPAAHIANGTNDDLPLHLACHEATKTSSSTAAAVCLDTILMLLQAYPGAVRHRNQQGQTPLDILLQRQSQSSRPSSHCVAQAILYLQHES